MRDYSNNNCYITCRPTDRDDLHRDRRAKAVPAAHVDLLDWHQDEQTHHGDEQLGGVGVREVLHHRC